MANYQVTGTVTELGVGVERQVRAYKADKGDFSSLGELVGSAASTPSGDYTVGTGSWAGPVFVVAIDDEAGANYDPGAIDWVIPVLGPAPTTYYQRIFTDLPDAFWQLDDVAPSAVALDASSAGLNGIYENAPTLEQVDTPYGNAGFSVGFNGSTQAMVSPSVLSPLSGADFTLEHVFKTGSNTDQVLFASSQFSYPSSTYAVLTLNRQDTSVVAGMITLELADDGVTINRFYSTSAVPIGDNEWHHLVVIKAGSSVVAIYDGAPLALSGALTLTGPTHNGTSHVFARAPDAAPGNGLVGSLFAIPLWKFALTEATAKVHFYILRRAAQAYLDRVLTDRPDRMYVLEDAPGESVALDLAGEDFHGAYSGALAGGAALAWEEPMATSAVFGAPGDRVEIELPFSDITPTSAFTFECWFQTTRTAQAYLLDRSGTSNRLAIVLNEDAAGAPAAGLIQCFISPAAGLYYRAYTTLAHDKIYDGTPHCLGVIYDHPDVMFILDGVVLASAGTIAVATVLKVAAEPQYIGASQALDAATNFIGNISHVAVWASALDQAEVQGHYVSQFFNYPNLVLADGSEAYWQLNEASAPINDSTGNYSNLGVTGTVLYGQPTLLPRDPAGLCIDFDGTGHVTLFNGPVVWNRSEWSMEAWFVIDAWPATNTAVLGQGSSGGNNVAIFVRPGPNRIDCGLWTGSQWYTLTIEAQLGKVYHVVFTEGTGGLTAYVNGSVYDSDPATPDGDSRVQFVIGRDADAASQDFAGRVQHAAVYYLTLNQAQIIEHFEGGFHGLYLEAAKADSPSAVWAFSDQLNAVQAVDFSPAVLHGTYRDGATSGGDSQLPAEPWQFSAAFQGANNSRVEVPAIFSSAAPTTAYTLEFWLTTTKTAQSHLWDRTQGIGLTHRLAARINAVAGLDNEGHVEVSHRGAGAEELVATQEPFELLTDGLAHHLVITYDQPFVHVYIDGVDVSVDKQFVNSDQLNRDNLIHFIGARYDLLQAEKFDGSLSFVGVWDGVALTKTQVLNHFTTAGGVAPSTDYEVFVLGLSPDGLWPLQETSPATTASDVSGNNEDGTYIDSDGGGTWLLRNRLLSSSALISSTETSRVEIPNVLSNPVTRYTIALWFSTTISADQQFVWDSNNVASDNNRIVLALNCNAGVDDPGYIAVYHSDVTPGQWVSTAAAYPQIYDGERHHLAAIYDEPNLTLLLDGRILATTGAFTDTATLTSGAVMQLGASRYLGAGTEGFEGNLAYVAIWNGVAITPATIRAAYFSGGGGPRQVGYREAILEEQPDSFWETLESSPATTLFDSTPNGNDGIYDSGVDAGGPSALPNDAALTTSVFTSTLGQQLIVPNGFSLGDIDQYTFEFWFRTTNSANRMFMWEKFGGTANRRIIIILNASVNNITLDPGFITISHDVTTPDTYVSNVTVQPQIYDGKPHHLGVIYTEPTVQIVLDGVSLPVTGDFTGETGPLNDQPTAYIGSHKSNNSGGFLGNLGLYAVWFDRALPLATVQAHYLKGIS